MRKDVFKISTKLPSLFFIIGTKVAKSKSAIDFKIDVILISILISILIMILIWSLMFILILMSISIIDIDVNIKYPFLY